MRRIGREGDGVQAGLYGYWRKGLEVFEGPGHRQGCEEEPDAERTVGGGGPPGVGAAAEGDEADGAELCEAEDGGGVVAEHARHEHAQVGGPVGPASTLERPHAQVFSRR